MNSAEMREANTYFKLPEHENIVKYQDCFFDQSNFFYLVLEYCNGGSLDKLIEVKTKFTFDKILQWTKEMIFGIEYLHSYNIMHRDIKPA